MTSVQAIAWVPLAFGRLPFGGHRYIQKAADQYCAKQYVSNVLQHLFVPGTEIGISYCVIAANRLPPHAVLAQRMRSTISTTAQW